MPPLLLNLFRGLEHLLLQSVILILDHSHSLVQVRLQLLLHHDFFLGCGDFLLKILNLLIRLLADLLDRLVELLFLSLDLVLQLSRTFLHLTLGLPLQFSGFLNFVLLFLYLSNQFFLLRSELF